MEGFYSQEELKQFKFANCGNDVFISKKASLYNTSRMSFGDNIRIDDFCVLVGNITFNNYIHIGAFDGLHASSGSITVKSYSTLSSNVAVYAASDDYSGNTMVNSMVPKKYKKVESSDIVIGEHVIVGTGTSILPGSILNDGVAVGAMSLVKTTLSEWTIYAGVPCKKIKSRSKKLLELYANLKAED